MRFESLSCSLNPELLSLPTAFREFMRIFLFILSVSILGGCAYVQDKAIQSITIRTPGAEDAICYVYVDKLRYKVNPPQAITVSNTKKNLVVDCLAPGNRRNKIVIEPAIAHSVHGNVMNGVVPGAAWDALSGAMYKFPDVIVVDFTDTLVSPESLPAHNNPDIKQPEDYFLEEFSPSTPRMNKDRYNTPGQIVPRERAAPDRSGLAAEMERSSGGETLGKGDLMQVIRNLNAAPDSSSPAPAYPGQ